MDDVSRRTLLAATAAGGIFAAATAAGAQPSEPVPQPQRPGESRRGRNALPVTVTKENLPRMNACSQTSTAVNASNNIAHAPA